MNCPLAMASVRLGLLTLRGEKPTESAVITSGMIVRSQNEPRI